MGHLIGGGGLYLRLKDTMKLGQLYLENGKWCGEQIVNPAWISQATSKQIDTPRNDKSDFWNCGYGYQFWMSPYPHSYRADGAFGQSASCAAAYISFICCLFLRYIKHSL
jgi:CubicO group peptidase (beta-lactamase class C family)